MISATVSGNLGADSELKDVNGNAVCEFRVASNNGKDKPATWVRCSIWGKRATTLANYLNKGTRVVCVGTLSASAYSKDGEARASIDMRVSEIDLMGGGQKPHDDDPFA